jgi:hypothetical protein
LRDQTRRGCDTGDAGTLGSVATDDRTEEGEEVEEEFRSLMEGLRTTLPGAQLVTAFLLTVPLYEKWDQLIRQERVAYYVAFVCAVLGTLLLMAPSSHQRVRTRDGVARRHRRHVKAAAKIATAGSLLFGTAIVAVAFLVVSFVLGTTMAVVVAGVVAAAWLWSWYYLPLVSFEKD